MLKYLPSLAIREMQIKSTLQFHPTPVRMSKRKKTDASEDVEKGLLVGEHKL